MLTQNTLGYREVGGSIPRPGHTRDSKNGTQYLPALQKELDWGLQKQFKYTEDLWHYNIHRAERQGKYDLLEHI